MTMSAKHRPAWCGNVPDRCQISQEAITDRFIDGATVRGPWAIMCPACHRMFGTGLGIGRGQLYIRDPDGVFRLAEDQS